MKPKCEKSKSIMKTKCEKSKSIMKTKSEKNMSKKQMMKHEKNESAKKRVMEAGTANGGRMSYSTSRKSC